MSQHYFLHVGLHKTATTATQNYLHKNLDLLLDNDVRYIPLYKMRNELTPLICSARETKRKSLFDFLASFPNKKILLSDENILGGTADIREGDLYQYAKSRVLSFCEEAGKRPVTIFLTLRDPASFISSMYCEHLRHSNFISFEQYTRNLNIKNFSYAQIFGWMNKLPKNTRVIVIPFESPPENGLLATASQIFKHTIGIHAMSGLPPFPDKRSRSSFSQEELELAAIIAEKGGDRLPQEFLKGLDSLGQRFGSTKFNPLAEELRRMLHERYQQELGGFFASMA